MDIAQKMITIIGAQRSGQALARLIVKLNGKTKISEYGAPESISEEFRQWAQSHKVTIEFNGHTQSFIEASDQVVLSPGVRFDAPAVQWAEEKKIPVCGEIEFAAQFCSKPVIAVTGTSGKTTVSTLIYQVLEAAGYKACLCGNIGKSFADYVLDLEDKDFVVLEVSSFQLESTNKFHPHIAVWLNFSQNHLDRHRDMEEYFEAKRKILRSQTLGDFAVLNSNFKLEKCYRSWSLNGNNEGMRIIESEVHSKVLYFNGSDGEYTENQEAVLKVAHILNIKKSICQEVFQNFQGIEHRLEWVKSLNGVDFINDSKATTVESGRWALTHTRCPVLMICGGRDKNSDFSSLSGIVHKQVKKMFVIGEAKDQLCQVFEKVVETEKCSGLESAVLKAKEQSSSGDTILFSPMCASFDMFADFEERGKKFKEIVKKIGTHPTFEQGQVPN